MALRLERPGGYSFVLDVDGGSFWFPLKPSKKYRLEETTHPQKQAIASPIGDNTSDSMMRLQVCS